MWYEWGAPRSIGRGSLPLVLVWSRGACGGMPDDCGYRLTSFEPIVEGLVRLQYHADGWELAVRHRHYAGRFGECPVALYSCLTIQEVAETLEATVWAWGPPSSHGLQAT